MSPFGGMYRNIRKKSSAPPFCGPPPASTRQEKLSPLWVTLEGPRPPSAGALPLLPFLPPLRAPPLGSRVQREPTVHALLPSDRPSRREGGAPLQTGSPRMGRFPGPAPLFLCVSPFCFAKPAGCTWTSRSLCSLTLPGREPAWHDPCWGLCSTVGSQLDLGGGSAAGHTDAGSSRLHSAFTQLFYPV